MSAKVQLNKGESIVQFCTLLTVQTELKDPGLGVAAGGSLDALLAGSDVAVSVFHGFYHLSRTILL